MSNASVTANIPKIGLELEGCVTHCGKLITRKHISAGLIDYVSQKVSPDEISFELYDPSASTYNRFEVKSEPSTDVLNGVMSLSERIEDLQHMTTTFYRAQYINRMQDDLGDGRISLNDVNQRVMFSGFPPDGQLESEAESYSSGLHLHAEMEEAARKDVARKLLSYVPMLAGLTMSSPFGDSQAQDYSMRMVERAKWTKDKHGLEETPAFRTNSVKNSYGLEVSRPETLELMICDSTPDPRAIAATAAIYQALVMKAQQGNMEEGPRMWQGDVAHSIKQLGKSGYDQALKWKGQEAEFSEIVDDVLEELQPQLEVCGTAEVAEYARHIAKGHTCAHQQKEAWRDFMETKMPRFDDTYRPDLEGEYRAMAYRKTYGYYLGKAEGHVEKDIAYRSLCLHREARTMFEEHSPDACPEYERD
jgi:hypothetical protein